MPWGRCVLGEDGALTPDAEPGQGAIVVALAAIGALVGWYDAVDEEAVDMAILRCGQAGVRGEGHPPSHPAHGPCCTHSASLHLEAHVLAFLRPHILQAPQEQQLRFSNMEPGTCGCAPCSGSHGPCVLKLAASQGQRAA